MSSRAPKQGQGRGQAGNRGRNQGENQKRGQAGSRGRNQGRTQGESQRRGQGGNQRRGQSGNRGKGRQPGDHQERRRRPAGLGGDRVEGRQAVRELLLAGARPTHEVVIAAGQNQTGMLAQIVELAAELRVPVKEVPKGKFESMTATEAPQGVMARAAPLREHDLDDLARPTDGRPPFLLVLDGITDPGNVGAALRTAECAGVTGAVLARHRAAHITPAAAKAAAGAVEHVPMALVPGIPNALSRLAELGVWTVGLDVAAPTTVYDMTVATDAIALVVGSEGRGLSRLSRQRCDLVAAIPLSGHLSSLNAAAATAIATFQIARHRQPGR